VLEGKGTIVEKEAGAEAETVKPVKAGDCLYCQTGNSHSLCNTEVEGDLVFYAVVPKAV
jgi:mannose-6-phosphate isomerase-like protein (cupin superfamily)